MVGCARTVPKGGSWGTVKGSASSRKALRSCCRARSTSRTLGSFTYTMMIWTRVGGWMCSRRRAPCSSAIPQHAEQSQSSKNALSQERCRKSKQVKLDALEIVHELAHASGSDGGALGGLGGGLGGGGGALGGGRGLGGCTGGGAGGSNGGAKGDALAQHCVHRLSPQYSSV